jgi:hypothetical protein
MSERQERAAERDEDYEYEVSKERAEAKWERFAVDLDLAEAYEREMRKEGDSE